MLETVLGLVTWKGAAVVGGAILAVWRARQIKKAVKEVADVFEKIQSAKADGKYTAKEVEEIAKEMIEAVGAIAPIAMRFFKKG
jgi:hypothetical protein